MLNACCTWLIKLSLFLAYHMHVLFICSLLSISMRYETAQEFIAITMTIGLSQVIQGLTWDNGQIPGLPVGAVGTWTFIISLVINRSWPVTDASNLCSYVKQIRVLLSHWLLVSDEEPCAHHPTPPSDWWNNSWELFLCWSAAQSIWNLEIGGLQRSDPACAISYV